MHGFQHETSCGASSTAVLVVAPLSCCVGLPPDGVVQPDVSHTTHHTPHHTPVITHHSSHTTQNTPLITHHSSHTTHHTPLISHAALITHHSSQTTHHTPLITHHSSHTTLFCTGGVAMCAEIAQVIWCWLRESYEPGCENKENHQQNQTQQQTKNQPNPNRPRSKLACNSKRSRRPEKSER